MRKTFQDLYEDAQDLTQDTSSTTKTFLQKEINNAVRFIYGDMRDYVGNKTSTDATVANTQYYDYPPDLITLENVVLTISSVDYTLIPVDSAKRWSELNAVDFSGAAIPSFFYPRRDDYGIYPTPQAVYTITLEYPYILKDMSQDDYTTGTATFTNGDETVTGSGTTWTAAMADRWIKGDDGLWYRIASRTSATAIEMDYEYAGTTSSGATYTIGETPEIPADMHELLPYRAAEMYFAGLRKDFQAATFWSNMFWTGDPQNTSRQPNNASGGYLAAKARYSARTDSAIVYKKRTEDPFRTRIWGTVLS